MTCETCGRKGLPMMNIPVLFEDYGTVAPQCNECIDFVRQKNPEQWIKAEFN